MRKGILFFISLAITSLIFGQIPEGYYNDAIGKKKAELKTALHTIIHYANVPGYGKGENSTWGAFTKTDVNPIDGTVWDMYSTNHVPFNGYSAASGMNIEHSFAKSWWGGQNIQPYKDIFHLYPSNSNANSARSSYPLGVVTGDVSYDNKVIKVGMCNYRPGGEIKVWEPADEYKGDFARTYMYMVTAYENFADRWTGNSVSQLDNNTYPVFEEWAINMLLEWSRQDPVSVKEINRNNEVYKIQGNRNPYIDFPLMAEYVWGNMMDVPFTPDGNIDFPYMTSPVANSTFNFGTVAYQFSERLTIPVKGVNIADNLTFTLSGTDASLFELSATGISAEEANEGYNLTVIFNASTLGDKTAQLTITGDRINTSVKLNATVSDSFMALPATGINAAGFTANWTTSAEATGYIVDVYKLEIEGETEYELFAEEGFNGSMQSGWSTGGYTSFTDLSGAIRLASSSNPGSVNIPVEDLPNAILTVTAKQYSNDTDAVLTVTVDGEVITTFTTGSQYKDFTVTIPEELDATNITLSAVKGERVYIDYVKIESETEVATKISVVGYPFEVGNDLSHVVTGLENNQTYYYTITPVGNNGEESDVITVQTNDQEVSVPSENKDSVHCVVNGNVLNVYNLPAKSFIRIFDLTGKQIFVASYISSEAQITLPLYGIYILQVTGEDSFETCKIIF